MSNRIWTTAIKGIGGTNEPFPCSLVRLGSMKKRFNGQEWQPAWIFHGIGSPQPIEVDAATLFIDRACTMRVFARVIA